MILVNNVIKEISWEGLLLSLKANEFYEEKNLLREDYFKLYSILQNPNEPLNISESLRNNLLLIILYNEIEDNKEFMDYYNSHFLKVPLSSLSKQGTPFEQMHFWFNLIEFDFKYRNRTSGDLKQIHNEIIKFSNLEKPLEDYILLKYYCGLIMFLLKNYVKSKEMTMDIILDLSDKTGEDSPRSNLLKFIELKNSILMIKTLEMENPLKNRQDIISNLECLYETAKSQNGDFAIVLGIKMNSIQELNVDYLACSKILDELLNILHREILFGKTKGNLIDSYLYVSALYGYYQTLLGNTDQVCRCIKKISKSLVLLDDIRLNNYNQAKNVKNLLIQYSFFNLVLKQNEKLPVDRDEQSRIITNYKTFLDFTLKDRNEVLLNIYAINNFDNSAQYYIEKQSQFQKIFVNREPLNDHQLLLAYLYLYNYISSLSKSLSTDTNSQKQSEYIRKIKDFAEIVINYTINGINSNSNLKALFQFNYFKEMFNRIYFSNIYSYYFEKKYKEAIAKVYDFLNCIKFQFELGTGKTYYNIIQIKGDSLMKLGDFKSALETYNSIIEQSQNKALVNFKLGVCNMMLRNIDKGKKYLQYSQQLYADDNEKIRAIDNMLKNVNI